MEAAQELQETIELDLDEENELLFKIQIEGADAPAKVRLVCESNDLSYMFYGSPTDQEGVVEFMIPEMKGKVKDGTLLESKVEVLIGNKYFSPVEFGINFKQSTKVFAEAVQAPTVKKKTSTSVSASPIIAVKPKKRQPTVEVSKPKPAVIEKPKLKKQGQSGAASSLHERYLQKKSK
jgi:hypothetical protein